MFRRVLLATIILASIPIVFAVVALLFINLRTYYWCVDHARLQKQ
jgi:hypothetical protein